MRNEKSNDNFRENLDEKIPEVPISEVTKPIRGNPVKRTSINALKNKQAREAKVYKHKNVKNKMARKSRRTNRKKR